MSKTGRSGGWNRGRKLPVKYLVVSEKALEQLQPRELTGAKEAMQLCRDLTLERRGTHVVVKVTNVISFDDVIMPRSHNKTLTSALPWDKIYVNGSFVWPESLSKVYAYQACRRANKRYGPKVFKVFLDPVTGKLVVKRVA